MDPLRFTVIGEAVPKGSVTAHVARRRDGSLVTRADGSPVVVKHDDTGSRGKASLDDIGKAALAAGAQLERATSLAVTLRFYRPRNAGHFGTGRNAGLVKDSAPMHPGVRPDVDKLTRHVLDALQGVVYMNDGQVVSLMAIKLFGEPARTEIEIAPMLQQLVGDVQLALSA